MNKSETPYLKKTPIKRKRKGKLVSSSEWNPSFSYYGKAHDFILTDWKLHDKFHKKRRNRYGVDKV